MESGATDRVIVATDSDEIASVVRERGGDVAMTRADHPSGTDRVAEVAERTDCQSFDVIVNVQGDEPFVRPEAIRGAAALVRSGLFPLATCATTAPAGILENPDVLLDVIRTELHNLKEEFGDARRSEIRASEEDLDILDLIAPEDVVVTLSHSGYAKRQPASA